MCVNWPVIEAAGDEVASRRAAQRLWSIMRTSPPETGRSDIYRLVDAHLQPKASARRSPIVDVLLGASPVEHTPRALIRHDVDSWRGMEQWQQCEEKTGLTGVYLLRAPVPESARLDDGSTASYPTAPPDYDVEDAAVREWASAALARGCQVGLHYGSARPQIVRAESRRLRDALGLTGPLPASAHWLQSSGLTLCTLDELGFGWDFSLMDFLSYAVEPIPPDQPRHPGFLTGTTHPHLLWDSQREDWLNLLAVPGGLEEVFVAGECPTPPTLEDIDAYIEHFRRHHGVIVLLWHSHRFDLLEHLERLVDRLRGRDFTFVTAADLSLPITRAPDSVFDPRA
ncbi:MAG TPA: hypothetical protein VMZ31_10265 [Phycisphaerae bacterium]|nr:hypothetical protein [Phycisphaerae bacterium]